MIKWFFVIVVTTILLSTSGFSQSINSVKLDSFFNILSANHKVMGSFAIAKNGKVIYERYIGYRYISNQQKFTVDKNTVYAVASVSKLFTAVMIYQLIDEGKLSIHTTLDKFFAEVPNAKSITIEHLLSHRSGLYDFENDEADKAWITKPHSKSEIIAKIIHGEVHFLPGKQTLYNNSGYVLLAYIIEKITGHTYNKNLQSRICSKIGLKNTYSPITSIRKRNEALSYTLTAKWEKVDDIYLPNIIGAGSILSNPVDLIIFDEALLNGKLISANGLKSMQTFNDEYTGTGIFRTHFYNNFAYGHDGDTYGTHSSVFYNPKDQLSIAYCINGEVYPRNDIAVAIIKSCYGRPYKIPEFKSFSVSKQTLNKYVGVYSNTELALNVTISQQDTILFIRQSGQATKNRLYSTKTDEFEIPADQITIVFNTLKNEMILNQSGQSYSFQKNK